MTICSMARVLCGEGVYVLMDQVLQLSLFSLFGSLVFIRTKDGQYFLDLWE